MKKFFIICSFCCLSLLVNAQVFTGVGISLLLPHESAIQKDFGGGINIYGGYCLNEKLDIGIDIQYDRFVTIVEKYSITGVQAFAKYHFFDGSVKPYTGVGIGFFQERWATPLDFPDYVQNGFGISPVVGLMFDNDLLPGLKVTTEFSYNYIFADQVLSNFGFNLGLKYYFL